MKLARRATIVDRVFLCFHSILQRQFSPRVRERETLKAVFQLRACGKGSRLRRYSFPAGQLNIHTIAVFPTSSLRLKLVHFSKNLSSMWRPTICRPIRLKNKPQQKRKQSTEMSLLKHPLLISKATTSSLLNVAVPLEKKNSVLSLLFIVFTNFTKLRNRWGLRRKHTNTHSESRHAAFLNPPLILS